MIVANVALFTNRNPYLKYNIYAIVAENDFANE